MSAAVIPFSLKDSPALIERLLPVQKLSAEAYKEQEGRQSKTLTPLGSYWKGRKPLILNRACILGCLLPATDDLNRDLEIFEMLMAMDDESFVERWPRRFKPRDILGAITVNHPEEYFVIEPPGFIPPPSPWDWSKPEYKQVKAKWRDDISELDRRRLESQMLPQEPYRNRVATSRRPEQVGEHVSDHVWDTVNGHLGTTARSLPELVHQLGIMRFGRRPRVADIFCGSGQIPFEAARLGCDVYASDLNPVACMLTWGAFNIVGGTEKKREELAKEQRDLFRSLQAEIDSLGVETDGDGWRAKVFLYCVEVCCPQTGWVVPLLPTLIISKGYHVVADLVPNTTEKHYEICVRSGASEEELKAAEKGTVGREGKYGEAYLTHRVEGIEYRTKISTLRGDHQLPDGTIANQLRSWDKADFACRPGDLIQERLYCIQWIRPRDNGNGDEHEFRTVTEDDRRREHLVRGYVAQRLPDWQAKGWIPDMRIEVGGPPRYQGLDLIRARGWTHWHHVFNPRQLLVGSLLNRGSAGSKFALTQVLNLNSRLSRFDNSEGGAAATKGAFDNQALNTIFNYGARGTAFLRPCIEQYYPSFPLPAGASVVVANASADHVTRESDLFITDPPYGDAVKYEEILDFFIGWFRKAPPPEFSEWVWDSRRALAIKGEDEGFRRNMVAAYKRMTECLADNGLQVVMFTHQDGPIWADMANIVWASGLQVTAAWYVATETESALRTGNNVKGTVLLVCRKRQGTHKTTRDDLAWEIQEEVESQVRALTGLNQEAKGLYRDENVFEDADLQMAGYAAALRVLTRYAVIDGRNMTVESIRPRVKGETTFVDGLIAFAVDTANQCLVPQGFAKAYWNRLTGAERFYLKMLDMESRGAKTLDNYQNFAKAFKVRDFQAMMASRKANAARLKNAVEFGRADMSEGSQFYESVLRAVLYAVMELQSNIDGVEVLSHLTLNVPNYYGDVTQRDMATELSDYLAKRLEASRPEEAAAARVLRELVKNQRLG